MRIARPGDRPTTPSHPPAHEQLPRRHKGGKDCDPGTHRPGRGRPGRWDPAGWRRHGLSGGPVPRRPGWPVGGRGVPPWPDRAAPARRRSGPPAPMPSTSPDFASRIRGGVPGWGHAWTDPSAGLFPNRTPTPTLPPRGGREHYSAGAVLWRRTRLVARSRRRLVGSSPRLMLTTRRAAASAISVSGWRTVVSGGPTQRATGRSS